MPATTLGPGGPVVSRLGLGLAALGRPAYITAGRADDLPDRSVAGMEARTFAMLDGGAGAVIVPDLGSAVLTVRAVLGEPGDLPTPVEVADAPFVEGVVAATVTAAGGGDIEAVVAAAEEARHARKL